MGSGADAGPSAEAGVSAASAADGGAASSAVAASSAAGAAAWEEEEPDERGDDPEVGPAMWGCDCEHRPDHPPGQICHL